MVATVSREDVQRLMSEGVPLVDVLDAPQYDDEHIAGAVNIPLGRLAEDAYRLRRDRPLVVYSEDSQCDLSARAAARLRAPNEAPPAGAEGHGAVSVPPAHRAGSKSGCS